MDSGRAVVDMVLLLDVSMSMCPIMDELKAGLQQVLQRMDGYQWDARFALVELGGDPRLRQPFMVSRPSIVVVVLPV